MSSLGFLEKAEEIFTWSPESGTFLIMFILYEYLFSYYEVYLSPGSWSKSQQMLELYPEGFTAFSDSQKLSTKQLLLII